MPEYWHLISVAWDAFRNNVLLSMEIVAPAARPPEC
jgi:hypothetical protein